MKVLIIGGSGFIGINAADYHLAKGDEVVIFDNFSRYGTLINLEMLTKKHGDTFEVIQGDIRIDQRKLEEAVQDVDRVYHLAAQVAVTDPAPHDAHPTRGTQRPSRQRQWPHRSPI